MKTRRCLTIILTVITASACASAATPVSTSTPALIPTGTLTPTSTQTLLPTHTSAPTLTPTSTPIPCTATADAEYIISGSTLADSGIFVDDILRVFVNNSRVAEINQGGNCCPPADPIRFVASSGDTLRLQAQDANACYSLDTLWLQKSDGSCLTRLTGDIAGPNCNAEIPRQVFFDETFTLP